MRLLIPCMVSSPTACTPSLISRWKSSLTETPDWCSSNSTRALTWICINAREVDTAVMALSFIWSSYPQSLAPGMLAIFSWTASQGDAQRWSRGIPSPNSSLFRDDLVFDLFVCRSWKDLFLDQLILSRIGPSLDNLFRVSITDAWKCLELVGGRRIDVEHFGLVRRRMYNGHPQSL